MVVEAEFTRMMRLDPLPAEGLTFEVAVDAGERRALAERLGVLEVLRFAGSGRVTRGGDRSFIVRGRLDARLARTCVITLEPVETEIQEPFEVVLQRPDADPGDDLLDPDLPDSLTLDGDEVDLGELLVEELALSLDPYPRLPDAALPPEAAEGPSENEPPVHERPFAALAHLAASARQR